MKYNLMDVYTETHDNAKHLPIMYSLAQGIRAENIVEIGVCWGISTVMFLDATKEWKGKLVSVDRDVIYEFLRDYIAILGFGDRWTYIQEPSDNAIGIIKDLYGTSIFDILYIDGSHEYEQVKRDLENYAPLVKPDGFILLHDTNSYEGPCRAFEENAHKYRFRMCFPWNNGLGILTNRSP